MRKRGVFYILSRTGDKIYKKTSWAAKDRKRRRRANKVAKLARKRNR